MKLLYGILINIEMLGVFLPLKLTLNQNSLGNLLGT